MNLPGYDAWLTHNPADDCCEFCGANWHECRSGWCPIDCTDQCGHRWRDPDDEHDRRLDR